MNKFSSIFSQVLMLFPRGEFNTLAHKHKAEHAAKGFTCWQQFVAMLFCQVGQAHSLREIVGGLASSFGKLKHLGLESVPKRSTLSYANNHRPWGLYQDIFYQMLDRCRGISPKHRFKFKNKLYSLDATVMELCASMFDWAKYRSTKGAVKLHLLLDHDGYLPVFAHVTEGNVHEINVARTLSLPKGSIVAMDRGYIDYEMLGRWTGEGVYFVTRLKDNAAVRVVRDNVTRGRNIVSDHVVELAGQKARRDCPQQLRLIGVHDPDTGQFLELLTNHHEFAASTVAQIYKERWQVEIFFKALKQNLRVKTFVGTSKNALLIQIWTALIAMLVLKYMQFKSTFGWSLSNLVAMLRYNLFSYRDLWAWLDSPYQPPPIVDDIELMQLQLP